VVNSPEIAHSPVDTLKSPGGLGADTANGTGTAGNASNSQSGSGTGTPGNASNSQGGSGTGTPNNSLSSLGGMGTGTPNNPSNSQGGFGTGALNSASNSMHLPRIELPNNTFKMPSGLGQTAGAIQFSPKVPTGQLKPSDLPNTKH
jgi:hypothetical protein